MSFGVELGGYAQLRKAVAFLKSRGVRFIDAIPPEFYLGIDYSAFALDPDGHCIQLCYYMEQVGWDGRVRPAAERHQVNGNWPAATCGRAWHRRGSAAVVIDQPAGSTRGSTQICPVEQTRLQDHRVLPTLLVITGLVLVIHAGFSALTQCVDGLNKSGHDDS
jgi:hypothetical protein